MSSMHKMMKKSKLQYEPKKRSTASGRDGRPQRQNDQLFFCLGNNVGLLLKYEMSITL